MNQAKLIQPNLVQKEALDAQIQKLEKLKAATAPVKNLLAELITAYAAFSRQPAVRPNKTAKPN